MVRAKIGKKKMARGKIGKKNRIKKWVETKSKKWLVSFYKRRPRKVKKKSF